jgi:hypothetical protein
VRIVELLQGEKYIKKNENMKKRQITMKGKVHDVKIVSNGSGFYIDPRKLDITKERILEYVETNPMPIDIVYGLEDLIDDLTDGSYPYMLPFDIKEETTRFILKLIDELEDGRKYDIWKL